MSRSPSELVALVPQLTGEDADQHLEKVRALRALVTQQLQLCIKRLRSVDSRIGQPVFFRIGCVKLLVGFVRVGTNFAALVQ